MVINDYAHASVLLGMPVPPDWMTLAIDDAVAALRRIRDRLWEVHIAVGTTMRGRPALTAFRAMLAWFWTNVDCDRLIGVQRRERRDAGMFTSRLGFRRLRVEAMQWPGEMVETVVVFMDRPA